MALWRVGGYERKIGRKMGMVGEGFLRSFLLTVSQTGFFKFFLSPPFVIC